MGALLKHRLHLITQKIRMLGTEFPLSVHQIKSMTYQLQIFSTPAETFKMQVQWRNFF